MADKKFNFLIKYDDNKNVVFIEQNGFGEKEDFIKFRNEYLNVLGKTKSDFTIINDQRELKTFHSNAEEIVKELVEITNNSHCKRVIRIVPASVWSKLKVNRTLDEAKNNYENIYVTTEEEAMKYIN